MWIGIILMPVGIRIRIWIGIKLEMRIRIQVGINTKRIRNTGFEHLPYTYKKFHFYFWRPF
jgi:hypothetical protein